MMEKGRSPEARDDEPESRAIRNSGQSGQSLCRASPCPKRGPPTSGAPRLRLPPHVQSGWIKDCPPMVSGSCPSTSLPPIAATAREHGLSVVTRAVSDRRPTGADAVTPVIAAYETQTLMPRRPPSSPCGTPQPRLALQALASPLIAPALIPRPLVQCLASRNPSSWSVSSRTRPLRCSEVAWASSHGKHLAPMV